MIASMPALTGKWELQQGFAISEIALEGQVAQQQFNSPMSAPGQRHRLQGMLMVSGLPRQADAPYRSCHFYAGGPAGAIDGAKLSLR